MTTMIKVSGELRDRLKWQAHREGLTLGGHLAKLADAEDRRVRMQNSKLTVPETSESLGVRLPRSVSS